MEGMTDSAAIINLSKLCVGVGLLALPSSVAQGGILFAPLGIINCIYNLLNFLISFRHRVNCNMEWYCL